ncbi:MAG: hypothetical protein IT239_01755, partial [Bacteroidia bacterium]|nr:hypothetical protein [Bacteroidia bacterium]
MFHSIAKNSQIKFVTVFFTLCFLGSYAQTTLVNYTFNAGNAYAALSGNPASGILSTINSDAAFTTAAGAATGNQAFTANAIAGNALVFDQISGASVLNLDVSLWGQKLNGFKDYKLYFQARRTTSGASLVKLYYSTDSASFTLLQNIDLTTQPASQYNQFLIDLSSFTALNNSSHLIFRLEIGGASALSGTCRIDNLQIQASCTQGAEPTVAVDSLEASNVGCQQLILHWKKGNGQKTLLIARAGSAVTATPTDLTAYNAASAFGSGSNLGSGQFVIYNDTNNQVTVSSLNQNTTYYFKAFVFNDNSVCSNSTNYLITGTEPTVNATTGQCFDILSILAHACGAPESYNEMFRFKTGNEPINIFDLQVGGSTSNNAINWGKWPNVNLPFNGFYQSNYTHIKVDSINNTITSCGILIEPPAGVIPPNKQVIVFTDTMVSPTANSFAALSDTLYAVFQKYTSSPAQGCFVNTNNGGFSATPNGTTAIRNLAMRSISNNNLSDQVSYDAKLLVNTNYGTINNQIYGGPSAVNRGATIIYDNPGNATYVNFGCRAPFIPFGVNPVITTVKSNNVLCTGDSILLKANPTGPYTSLQWTGGNGGTFITPAPGIDSIWYVATPTDVGNVSFNVHIVGYCGNIIDSTVHIIVVRPSTAFITPTGPTTFCQGDSVTLQGNSGSG